MDFKSKRFAFAVTTTVLDLISARRYGREVSRAFSPIIWCRILLLLLFAGMADKSRQSMEPSSPDGYRGAVPRRIRLSAIESSLETERADV